MQAFQKPFPKALFQRPSSKCPLPKALFQKPFYISPLPIAQPFSISPLPKALFRKPSSKSPFPYVVKICQIWALGEGFCQRAFVGGLLEEGVWNEGIFFRWLLDLKGFWKRAYFGRASGSTLYFSSNYVCSLTRCESHITCRCLGFAPCKRTYIFTGKIQVVTYRVRIPDNI